MTHAELLARLQQQAVDAERVHATAPVAAVIKMVLEELEQLSGIPAGGPDRLISLDEAASRLGVDKRWLTENRRDLPFLRRLTGRTVRVSERGLYRWLETRTP